MATAQTAAAVKAAAAKRTAEGVVFMECAVCGKPMKRWRSQVTRAKLPMTCSNVCKGEARKGAANHRWKNGVWADTRSGYRFLRTDMLSPEDQALLPTPMPRQYPEHRMVMARMMGRVLRTDEHVHHVNGEKADNRPENLTAMDWTAHTKEHRKIMRRLSTLEAENRVLRAALAERSMARGR